MITIRPEQPADHTAIFALHAAAFPTDLEAKLVDAIRANDHATISLVAIDGVLIVGHVLLSPVTIESDSQHVLATGLGLAPVAVHADYRRQGIAARLIEQAIGLALEAQQPFVVVLGEPGYYQRFGFRTASAWQVSNEYGVNEPFMLRELAPGGVPASGGLAKYGSEFADLV